MTEGVALSISQFLDAWRIFGRGCPGSRVESAAGVDYVFTGLPIAFFNVAVATGGPLSAALLDTAARGAMQWAADKNAPAAVSSTSGLVTVLPSFRGGVRREFRPRRSQPGLQIVRGPVAQRTGG